ncbi:hypothetical protein FRX31_023514 [Thalictrum thalictroides]|uniref:Uncharacterized protein n=1 Tax=Thalictrum thalictroides TaxID=46969 RepID=A0A7J6VP60_THATH|nr:hypothetical protein FRX31_023514 [Thalictrum thalictroides]
MQESKSQMKNLTRIQRGHDHIDEQKKMRNSKKSQTKKGSPKMSCPQKKRTKMSSPKKSRMS